MPAKELAILDLDDTIVLHAKRIYNSTAIATTREAGIPTSALADDEVIRRINSKWGSRHEHYLTAAWEGNEISAQKRHKAFNYYLEYFRARYPRDVVIVPGAAEVLSDLKSRGLKLGITTAAPREVLKNEVWEHLGFPIEDIFDDIISAYDLIDRTQAKPHPFTLEKIMQNQNVAPARAVMIGDSPNDYRAAVSAGVDFIGVETGIINRKTASALNIKNMVANVAQIVPVIEKLDRAAWGSYGDGAPDTRRYRRQR